MKVIFSNSLFFHQKYGGVTRFSSCILNKMIEKKIDCEIVAPIYKNFFLNKIDNKFIKGKYFPRYPNLRLFRSINEFLLGRMIKNSDKKIIHHLYDPEKIHKSSGKLQVLTIHDLIHEKFKELYKKDFQSFRKKIFVNIDFFICDSANTKKDLLNYYDISPEKIQVVYLGSDHLEKIDISHFNEKKIFNQYILFVGSI